MKRAGLLAITAVTLALTSRTPAALCVVASLWLAAAASAQLRALIHYDDAAIFQEYRIGVVNALPAGAIVEPAGVAEVIERLSAGEEWDFVCFVHYRRLMREEHEGLAEAFERHISRGGTLAITYPHLDEAPELWEVLGVASAEDPVEPEGIVPTDPRHPMWLGSGAGGPTGPTLWSDFGDVLEPMGTSRVIGVYEKSGLPAFLESRSGQVIVSGVEWDSFGPESRIGRDQTRYLTMCIPDFDDNGVLDFFDFLAFQNAFAAKDPRADLARDGRFDLFDFLAFQELFAYGCPRGR